MCVLSMQSMRYVPEPERNRAEDHRSDSRETPCHSMFKFQQECLCNSFLGDLLYMDKRQGGYSFDE